MNKKGFTRRDLLKIAGIGAGFGLVGSGLGMPLSAFPPGNA